MSDHETRKTPAAWMRNLLLGSVALNVFLAGFLFARVLGPEPPTGVSVRPQVSLGTLPADLSPQMREAFENNFKVHEKDVEKKYQDLFEARQEVHALMELPQLDEAKLREALEKMSGLQLQIQGAVQDTMVETLKNMDPKMRQMFILGGDPGFERGIWTQRQFDGSRWRVELEDGQIVLDFRGLKREDDDKDDDSDPSE